MKEYEIVEKYYNACAGKYKPQTSFEEAELANPDDYVRRKHGKEFDKFQNDQDAKDYQGRVFTHNHGKRDRRSFNNGRIRGFVPAI